MRMGRTAAALRALGPAQPAAPAGDGARGRSRLSMATEPAHFWQLKTAQGRTSRAAGATGGSREAPCRR